MKKATIAIVIVLSLIIGSATAFAEPSSVSATPDKDGYAVDYQGYTTSIHISGKKVTFSGKGWSESFTVTEPITSANAKFSDEGGWSMSHYTIYTKSWKYIPGNDGGQVSLKYRGKSKACTIPKYVKINGNKTGNLIVNVGNVTKVTVKKGTKFDYQKIGNLSIKGNHIKKIRIPKEYKKNVKTDRYSNRAIVVSKKLLKKVSYYK
jgi:hypothetical protein